MSEPEGASKAGTYHRESGGLDFERVSFTDAVYAIAMTLLVIDLHVLSAPEGLGVALREMGNAILGFFLGFLIIRRQGRGCSPTVR